METNYFDVIKDEGFSALPGEVQKLLRRIETMPGDPASSLMKRKGMVDIRPEEFRMGRGVYTHEDTPGVVYKVGVGTNAWQNNIEKRVWEEERNPSFEKAFPGEILQYLAPVVLSHNTDGDCHWLIMAKGDIDNVEEQDVIEVVEGMLETGWVVTDYHTGNLATWRGDTVFIDYGQMKPERYLRDEWREKIKAHDW